MEKKKLNRRQVKRFDPTRTGMIRRRFEAEIRRRMRTLSKEISDLLTGDVALDFVEPTTNGFVFRTAADAVDRFRNWLRSRADSIVLETKGVQNEAGEWIGPIVETAYFKGSEQAEAAIQRASGEVAEQAPPLLGGRVSQFLRAPVNIDKIKLLTSRAYEQLKGIVDSMAVRLGNILADGITRGESPRTVARTISREIQGVSQRQALTIARTETIRAHAEGSLDAMEQMGVTEVGVTVEWQATYIDEDAGIFEERVCPKCRAMAGVVLPIEQAHGMIPLHPNCRCAWVPSLDEPTSKKQVEKRSEKPTMRERAKIG